MTAPVRLQLSRKKGFNLQAHSHAANGLEAVNCARPGKWGNPYKIGDKMWLCSDGTPQSDAPIIETNAQAADAFRRHLEACLAGPGRASLLAALEDLRGKNLACWCPLGSPCHADILLEIANGFVSEDAAP